MTITEKCLMIARSLFAETGNWGHKCALIGGLIPGLITEKLPPNLAPHIGTTDVDLAIKIAATKEDDPEFYKTLKANLTNLGLKQDQASFRWLGSIDGSDVIVELFVQVDEPEQGGKIEKKPVDGGGSGLTALGLYGLQYLENDIIIYPSTGPLMNGKGIKDVELRLCGPAMLICLKAWAIEQRTKSKDGYDIVWMLNAIGPEKAAELFKDKGFAGTEFGKTALEYLEKNFATVDHTGPMGWVEVAEISEEESLVERRRAVGLVNEFIENARK